MTENSISSYFTSAVSCHWTDANGAMRIKELVSADPPV